MSKNAIALIISQGRLLVKADCQYIMIDFLKRPNILWSHAAKLSRRDEGRNGGEIGIELLL